MSYSREALLAKWALRPTGLRPAGMVIARTARSRTDNTRPARVSMGRVRKDISDASKQSVIAKHPAADAVRLSDVPLPVLLLLVTMLVPRELEVNVGIALTAQRLVLLVYLPIAMASLFSSRTVRLRSFDVLIVAAFAYFWLTLFTKEVLEKAIQSGSSQFLEAVGGYVIARVYIRTPTQFLAVVKLLFVLAMAAGAAAAVESIGHIHWLKNLAIALSGAGSISTDEVRLGFMRAAASFDHPIHYGTFCTAVMALCWYVERRSGVRVIKSIGLSLAAFFSLSSAAIVGCCLVLAGALLERATRSIPHRVWALIAGATGIYAVLLLVAKRSPASIIGTALALDPATAYYRLAIWEYGSENVLNNPWFGVALGTWERPSWMYSSTVDHYWLVTAMNGGLPTAFLYGLAILTLAWSVYRPASVFVPEAMDRRRCRYAWTAAILVMIWIGTTVHYWRALEVFFTFLLGLGAWLATDERGAGEARVDGSVADPASEPSQGVLPALGRKPSMLRSRKDA